MFIEVRAVAGRFTLVIYMPYETAFREGFEGIVNGGEGDRRHPNLHPHEDFYSAGMIALRHEGIVDLPPLLGETKPFFGECISVGFRFRFAVHTSGKGICRHAHSYQE